MIGLGLGAVALIAILVGGWCARFIWRQLSEAAIPAGIEMEDRTP